MKKGFYDLLKGKFLISDDAFKNWRFIFFISVLMMLMIGSSHRADKKVHRIAQLNNEFKEINLGHFDRSAFQIRSDLFLIDIKKQ